MSVTTRPNTESPRNSRRSFVGSRPCSNAYERCVSAACRSNESTNATSIARSRASSGISEAAVLTPLLDLDRPSAGVVTAIAADDVRELGLMALRAIGVCRCLRLPVRGPFVAPGLALLLLGNGHGFLSFRSAPADGARRRAPTSADPPLDGRGGIRRGCGPPRTRDTGHGSP